MLKRLFRRKRQDERSQQTQEVRAAQIDETLTPPVLAVQDTFPSSSTSTTNVDHDVNRDAQARLMMAQAQHMMHVAAEQIFLAQSAANMSQRTSLHSKCEKMHMCWEVLDSLGIDPSFFNHTHDQCYCSQCANSLPQAVKFTPRECSEFTEATSRYEIPHGWSGFGLELPPRHLALDIFKKWSVSYHGCPANRIDSILKHGSLHSPGEMLLNGTPLRNRATGGGDHRLKIYTSPSILYAGLDIYTCPQIHRGSTVRVVLQCRQKTHNTDFCVNGETIGWARRFPGAQVSPYFSNSELEWSTRAKEAVIPYRILVSIGLNTREQIEQEQLDVKQKARTQATERCRTVLNNLPKHMQISEEWQRCDEEARKNYIKLLAINDNVVETLVDDVDRNMNTPEVQELGWKALHILSRRPENKVSLVSFGLVAILCRTILQHTQTEQLRSRLFRTLGNISQYKSCATIVFSALEAHKEAISRILAAAQTETDPCQEESVWVILAFVTARVNQPETVSLAELGMTDDCLHRIFQTNGSKHEKVLREIFTTLTYVVKGVDKGRNAWYLVKVDLEKINEFKKALKDDIIHLKKHGYVLESAFGECTVDPMALVAKFSLGQIIGWMKPKSACAAEM